MDRLLYILENSTFSLFLERGSGNVTYTYQFAFRRDQGYVASNVVGACIKVSRDTFVAKHPVTFVPVTDTRGYIVCEHQGKVDSEQLKSLSPPRTIAWHKITDDEYWFIGCIRDLQTVFTTGTLDDHFGIIPMIWGKLFNGKAILKIQMGGIAKMEVFILNGIKWNESQSNILTANPLYTVQEKV